MVQVVAGAEHEIESRVADPHQQAGRLGAAHAEWGAGSWGEIVWNDVAASVPVLGPSGLVVLTASVIAVGSGWMKAAAQRHGDDPS